MHRRLPDRGGVVRCLRGSASPLHYLASRGRERSRRAGVRHARLAGTRSFADADVIYPRPRFGFRSPAVEGVVGRPG